jgi:hypothetical protein
MYFNDVPDDTTLIRWADTISAKPPEAYNQRATQFPPLGDLQFGLKIWLDVPEGGIVTHWFILEGNPSDKYKFILSLETHQLMFGQPPNQTSADRSIYSASNQHEAKHQNLKQVVLPKPGKKSEKRQQLEKQSWFRKARW